MLLDIFSSLDYQFSKFLLLKNIVWVLSIVWVWLILFKYYFYQKYIRYFYLVITNLFLKNLNRKNVNIFQNIFRLIYSFSFIIIFINFWSLIPYVYGLTTKFIVGLTFGLSYWLMLQIRSIENKVKRYVSHFAPAGTDLILAIILRYVDLVRTIVRPFTLTLRLVIKMSIGHVIFSLLGLVISSLYFRNLVFCVCLMVILLLFFFIELFVRIIQSLVFGLLNVNYLGEHS